MMGHFIANRLHAVLLLVLAVITVWGFFVLPLDASLPVHWNIEGVPDRFAPAPVALLVAPLVSLAVPVLVGLINARSTPGQRAARRHVDAAVFILVAGLGIVIQVIMVRTGMGAPVDVVRVVVLAMAVLLAVLGNVLPKSRRNAISGIRVGPSLADDANWQATQRFGGRLFVIAGVLLGVLALVTDQPVVLIVATILAAAVPGIAAMIYSYRHRS